MAPLASEREQYSKEIRFIFDETLSLRCASPIFQRMENYLYILQSKSFAQWDKLVDQPIAIIWNEPMAGLGLCSQKQVIETCQSHAITFREIAFCDPNDPTLSGNPLILQKELRPIPGT